MWQTFLLSVWTERRNKKEPRTRSAVEQMGFSVSGCGTRGFAAQTVLARDDTEKPHLLPTAPAIVRPANTPPLVGAVRRALAIVRPLPGKMCEGLLLSFATCRGRCAKGLRPERPTSTYPKATPWVSRCSQSPRRGISICR